MSEQSLTPAESAHELREEGLHVFPLGTYGETAPSWVLKRVGGEQQKADEAWPKTPRFQWAEYQVRPPSDEEIDGWEKRAPGCNWAIATGVGVVVVDADTAEGCEFMESGAVTRSPRKVVTSKGAHYYFAVHASIEVRNSAGKHIDIRGSGGYVVAEGSRHYSGSYYTREDLPGVDCGVGDLPHLSRDDLDKIRAFNSRDTIVNGPIVVDGKLNFDATTVDPNGGSAGPVLDLGLDGEGERNVTASRLAGKHIGAGHSLAEVKQLLDAWNLSNANPLTVDELNQTISSVARTHTRKNPNQPIAIVPATLEEVPFYDLFDLMDDPRELPGYQVEGLFRQGDNVVLAGPPKSMKSFLLQDLLFAMAWGLPFLGHDVTREHKIAWIQAEMPWHETQRRALGHPWAVERKLSGDDSNLFVSDRLTSMAFDPRGVNHIIELIGRRFEGEVPDVIAIDSLSAVFDQEDENSNSQMQAFLRERLGRFREVFGPEVTIMVIHHTNKASAAAIKADPFSVIRGASALRGWYSAGLVMHRDATAKSPKRELHFELRGDAEPDSMALELRDGVMKFYTEPEVDVDGMIADVESLEFMSIFDHFESEGRQLTSTKQGPFAPQEFAKYLGLKPSSPGYRKKVAAFTTSMKAYIMNGDLVVRDTSNGLRGSAREGLKSELLRGNYDDA